MAINNTIQNGYALLGTTINPRPLSKNLVRVSLHTLLHMNQWREPWPPCNPTHAKTNAHTLLYYASIMNIWIIVMLWRRQFYLWRLAFVLFFTLAGHISTITSKLCLQLDNVYKYMLLAKTEDLLQKLSWFLFGKLELLNYFSIYWSVLLHAWPNLLNYFAGSASRLQSVSWQTLLYSFIFIFQLIFILYTYTVYE